MEACRDLWTINAESILRVLIICLIALKSHCQCEMITQQHCFLARFTQSARVMFPSLSVVIPTLLNS